MLYVMIKYLLSMFIYEGDPRNVINLRFHWFHCWLSYFQFWNSKIYLSSLYQVLSIDDNGFYIKSNADCFKNKTYFWFQIAFTLHLQAKKFAILFCRSSPSELFLGKGVLETYTKFTREHPCSTVISIKSLCNFIKFALLHSCKFAAYFQNTFLWERLWRVASAFAISSYHWIDFTKPLSCGSNYCGFKIMSKEK